jgi:iron(III) transport system ATP-binding protein
VYLAIEDVRKTFGDVAALDGVSLGVERGDFVCLLGPSGCGKTTLLRIVAGLLTADSGRLSLAGSDLTAVPARQRNFGIVFQSYSLFPNMTIAENIGYGLRIRGVARAKIDARVRELLDMIKLPQIAGRYPWQLSGGQQQRVALARAIAVEPALLLLDEPLSALDAKVRAELREEIRELQRRLGVPTIMVTHDQEEALTLADRILCMNQGRVEQAGTPADLYLRPATRFVADFMGVSNLIEVERVQAYRPALLAARPATGGARQLLCVRPEKLHVVAGSDCAIAGVAFLGNLTRLRLDTPLGLLTAELPGHVVHAVGARVGIEFGASDCAWVAA